MKDIIPFDFGSNIVRVHQDDDGNPWFIAKDVCDVLEISNSRDALSTLDEDEKNSVGITDGIPKRGNPTHNTISESGLYSLIFKSRKPEAKKFRKWITSEVIPSLRKTGSYVLNRQSDNPATFNQHKELFPLITEWSVLLKNQELWQPQEIFHQSVMAMQVALGNPKETSLKALSFDEVEYAKEYLNSQITILKSKSGEIKSPEEIEAAQLRSERASKAARARWNKVKEVGK